MDCPKLLSAASKPSPRMPPFPHGNSRPYLSGFCSGDNGGFSSPPAILGGGIGALPKKAHLIIFKKKGRQTQKNDDDDDDDDYDDDDDDDDDDYGNSTEICIRLPLSHLVRKEENYSRQIGPSCSSTNGT